MIEEAGHDTGSSFQQQAGMVKYLARILDASVKYEVDRSGRFPKATAVLSLKDGTEKRFNVYGAFE